MGTLAAPPVHLVIDRNSLTHDEVIVQDCELHDSSRLRVVSNNHHGHSKHSAAATILTAALTHSIDPLLPCAITFVVVAATMNNEDKEANEADGADEDKGGNGDNGDDGDNTDNGDNGDKEGRRKDEGRRTKDEGRRTKDEGRRTNDERRKQRRTTTTDDDSQLNVTDLS